MSGMGLVGIGLGVGGLAILAWTVLARTPAPRSRPTASPSPGTAPLTRAPPHHSRASPFSSGRGWLDFEDTRPGGGRPTCSGRRRDPGRLAAWYLRLPYALGAPGQGGGGSRPGHPGRPLGGAGGRWTATLGPGWAAAAGVLTLAAGIADSVDGAVAVLQRRTSVFGFVWDSTADRLADWP